MFLWISMVYSLQSIMNFSLADLVEPQHMKWRLIGLSLLFLVPKKPWGPVQTSPVLCGQLALSKPTWWNTGAQGAFKDGMQHVWRACMYIPRTQSVLCFGGWTLKNKVFDNQNKGHVASRKQKYVYIFIYIYIHICLQMYVLIGIYYTFIRSSKLWVLS